MRSFFRLILVSLFLHDSIPAAVKCVDVSNTGVTQNGTPQYPYASIRAAINAAASGDTVKVAAGTYYEIITILQKTVKLLGGYNNAFTFRDPEGNVSKIVGRSDTAAVAISRVGNCKVDGFTITGGRHEIYSAAEECPASQSYLNVRYTLSTDLQPGTGNISADPLFADTANGDFHLKSAYGRRNPADSSWVADAVTSPAIDAGDPGADFSLEPSQNGGGLNMGCYGNTAEAGKSSGNAEIGSGFLDWIAKSRFQVRCASSPSDPVKTVYYQLPSSGMVQVRIYTPAGKPVAVLENGLRTAGPHRAVWKARQPAGVYMVHLTAGEYQAVRRITLAK